ncbi:MAG: dihydropyrimidinase [Fusobacteriaceae bacterium]
MILKNGKVLMGDRVEQVDIAVKNDKIEKIGVNLTGDNIIDVSNKYVVAGGIDPHTHFNIDVGIVSVDDYESGSIAAACGGTTTVIDHPGFGPKGCKLDYMIEKYREYGKKSYIDYLFHGVAQEIDSDTFYGLKKLKNMGINSFKFYLTYVFKQTDNEILQFFQFAKDLDMITTVHAENDSAINYLRKKFISEGKVSPIYHSYSRAGDVEAEAVSRLIKLAHIVGYEKLYLVHMASKEAMYQIALAKAEGKKFFVETCPQYFYLDDSNYLGEDAVKYILSPPLRPAEDIGIIWNHIKEGYVDTIGTDHCTFSLEDKLKGKNDFTKCPNGIPGVEERVPLLFTEFLNGRLTAKEFSDLTALNSAKIFGLADRKGSIEVGKDADFAVFEIKSSKIEEKNMHTRAKYSCFQDFELEAVIDKTFVRGNFLVDNGKFICKEKIGKFLGK